jgi:hypothetical protein
MNIASIGLTDRQRRALAGMGIDVWIQRDASVAATPAVVVTPSQVRAPESTARAKPSVPGPMPENTTAPAPTTSPRASELKITLDCIAAGGFVAVGECAGPPDLQLAKDIVVAFAGAFTGSVAQPQKSQFRWPQTQTGDASESAARNAYRGFLRGQIERANARCLLLFGAAAHGLLEQDTQLGVDTRRLPDLRTLRADPNEKKQLWLNVSTHIRA